jgi:hypothetical protein
MDTIAKWFSNEACVKGWLISLVVIFMFIGCASSPKQFDPKITGPQMIVEPGTIRLGIAKLKDTEIVFRGKGFQPEDSVFIKLLDVKKGDKVVDIPVADGNVNSDGSFTAKVGILPKINELLNAQIGSDEEMETIIIVTQPPIASGVYTARAVSMESDLTAECQLVVKDPSLLDRLKDWIGGLLGKIVKK